VRTRPSRLLPLVALAVVLPLAACAPEAEQETDDLALGTEVELATEVPGPTAEADAMAAMATLENAEGQTVGEVRFVREAGGVRVIADLEGVAVEASGPHGFHVHENGTCDPPDFTSAGGHFNPTGAEHACPPTTPRHAGDLGNIELADDGSGHLELTTDLLALDGADSVIGKAVLLHGHVDDCASQPSGDAGPRLACGVVALSQPTAVDQIGVSAEDGTAAPPAP
jgi:superoxide dismutase, Cu-Zn family